MMENFPPVLKRVETVKVTTSLRSYEDHRFVSPRDKGDRSEILCIDSL